MPSWYPRSNASPMTAPAASQTARAVSSRPAIVPAPAAATKVTEQHACPTRARSHRVPVATTDGSCTFETEAACTGTWLGYGTDCDPNPCPQSSCLGDLNCSGGAPTFEDIVYFVAALNGEAGWMQYYRDHNGGSDPPWPVAAG